MVVLVVLSMIAVPAAAEGTMATAPTGVGMNAQEDTNQTATNTSTPTASPEPTATPASTATQSEEASSSPPPDTMAGQSRISPLPYGEDYMEIRIAESDRVFNTSGPFASFTTSNPLQAARIDQPGAEADVLDGSHAVHVNYEDDAAPPGQTTLYQLELFFEDGSSKVVRLYATDTEVDTAPAELQEAASFIEQMKQDAQAHDFKPTIEGIQAYHEWEKEQADLFRNLFTEQLARIMSIAILTLQTPLALILGFLVAIALALWLLRKHKLKFRDYNADENVARRKRRELRHKFHEQMQTADEHHLREVGEIGSQHIYWGDAFNVHSVKQLADLAATGRPATDEQGELIRGDDGSIELEHRGVFDLDADNVHEDGWVRDICKPKMLSPVQALGHMKKALQLMESKYEQGHHYRGARQRTTQLIDDLQDGSHLVKGSMGSGSDTYGPAGASPGGDD